MSICQDADLRLYFHQTAAALRAAYTLSGRLADAMLLFTQAVEQSAAMERADYAARCHISLGEAQMLAGRLEEAYALAGQVLARTRQERGNQAYALRLLGDIAAQHKPPESDQAEDDYHQAMALAAELGMRPLLAHCHLGLGTLYGKMGRGEQARRELSAAIELYRALEMTFWLPQTEAALAEGEGCPSLRWPWLLPRLPVM
jgi:tetratricopeptide (TPR) repeat protein